MVITTGKQHEELKRCSHCLFLLEKDLTKNQKIKPDMPKNTLRH